MRGLKFTPCSILHLVVSDVILTTDHACHRSVFVMRKLHPMFWYCQIPCCVQLLTLQFKHSYVWKSQVLRMLEGEMIIDAHAGSPLSMYGSNRLVYEHPGISQNPKVWTNIAKPSSDHQSNGSSNYSSPNGYLLISSLQTSPRTLSPSSLPPSGRGTPEPNVSTRSSKLSFEALKAAYKEKPSYSTHGSMLAYDSSTAGKNL